VGRPEQSLKLEQKKNPIPSPAVQAVCAGVVRILLNTTGLGHLVLAALVIVTNGQKKKLAGGSVNAAADHRFIQDGH
jgi:hypothetical protein